MNTKDNDYVETERTRTFGLYVEMHFPQDEDVDWEQATDEVVDSLPIGVMRELEKRVNQS